MKNPQYKLQSKQIEIMFMMQFMNYLAKILKNNYIYVYIWIKHMFDNTFKP